VAINGSVANLNGIVGGSIESGFSQADVNFWAFTATGIDEGKPKVEELRAIGTRRPPYSAASRRREILPGSRAHQVMQVRHSASQQNDRLASPHMSPRILRRECAGLSNVMIKDGCARAAAGRAASARSRTGSGDAVLAATTPGGLNTEAVVGPAAVEKC
jgi:hypothetical protein